MAKVIKLRLPRRIVQLFVLLILFSLAAFLLLGRHPAYADSYNARVFAEDQTIHRGQTFEVDIQVADNTGLQTLYLTVKFDHSVFTLTDVQQVRQALGQLNLEHSGSGYDYIDEKTGGFNLFWDGSKADATNGTIVRLTFQSALTAPTGTYPIDIVLGERNTTVAYNVPASVQVTSPKITLTEGAYIVVWHDWAGNAIRNPKITGHPYNPLTGGYEYNSDDELDPATDFPDDPVRPEDSMYSYAFSGWRGAVWRGDVPLGSSVIYYVAQYIETPQVYNVWYYVDGIGIENSPDGKVTEEELYTAKSTSYNAVINESDVPYRQDYTFYGWFTDPGYTRKLISPLMPANDVKLYGYFKYNIRETDVPVLQLTYRETVTNGEQENIAYVDVYVTRNYGLSSLMITLSEYDTENFTFCGFEKGEIFKQMSFFTTNYENDEYPENFSFSWNNSYQNSYELGLLLVLKFRLNPGSSPGAYPVTMTADTKNTTYVKDDEIWYSEIEFLDTKIPIGKTNYWKEPIPSTDVTVEIESPSYVPYNVELIVKTEKVDGIIDDKTITDFMNENRLVFSLFDIYFQQNATKLTQEQYRQMFGDERVTVKIKLTASQLSSKRLDIYYVDDDGGMILYESSIEDGYLIFETNHFSHWALVGDYVLTTTSEVANLRLLRISLLLFGISACALIAIAFVRSRKKQPLFSLSRHFSKHKGG